MRKNINIPSALNSWYTLSGFLCLTLVFASCGQSMEERDNGFGTLGESVPLSVQASLVVSNGQAGEQERPASRATTDPIPITVKDATIGVFLSGEGEGYAYTPQYDRKYIYRTATPAGWQPVDPNAPITVKTNPAKVVAYYDPAPTGKVTFDENSTTTTSTLNAQDYAEDKLWYYDNTHTNVTSRNPTINFNMKPAYARLSFQISRNENYLKSCTVTQIVIKSADGSKFYTSATVDIADGLLKTGTLADNYTIVAASLKANTPALYVTSADLLFPAPQLCSGLTLTLIVDNETLSVTIPKEKFAAFVAGAHYKVLVQISSAGVNAVTIRDSWDTGTINGGIPMPTSP